MKYSIIIPTLNEEKLLPLLLGQLADNNLKSRFNYEVIISDGGSSDKTVRYSLPVADVVKVHSDCSKQNIAKGRNEGAKFSTGEVLIFLNGDIRFNDIKKFFSFLDKEFYNSDYLAMTCYVRISPEERTAKDIFFHYIYNRYFHLLNSAGIGMGRGECQIIWKKIFDKVGGYNENLAAGEDFDLFKRVRSLGKILFTKKIYIYESPRRFRKLGYIRVTAEWIRNGISVFMTNKAVSSEWEEIR